MFSVSAGERISSLLLLPLLPLLALCAATSAVKGATNSRAVLIVARCSTNVSDRMAKDLLESDALLRYRSAGGSNVIKISDPALVIYNEFRK